MADVVSSVPWYASSGPDSDVVVSSRVRLARNVSGGKFVSRLDAADDRAMRTTVFAAVDGCRDSLEADTHYIRDFSTEARRVLVDRSVFSQAYSVDPERAFACSGDCSFSLVVNETDHVRFHKFVPGLALEAALASVRQADLALERSLDFSVRVDLGYVTQNLADIGTGMKAQVLLHMPALADTGLAEKALKGVMEDGISVTGLAGDAERFTGAYFILANQVSIGDTEEGIARKVADAANRLARYERLAREELMDKKRNFLVDSVARAYGTALYARLLPLGESVDLAARIRLGITLGLIGGMGVETADSLLYSLKTSHLALGIGAGSGRGIGAGSGHGIKVGNALSGIAFDAVRADILRDSLSKTTFRDGAA